MNDPLIDWLRLARTPQIGPITFKKCIESFGSASKAIDALPELSKRGGRKNPLIAPSTSDIQDEIDALSKIGGAFLTWEGDAFPQLLLSIEDCPPVLSCLGNIDLLSQQTIGIVGARNASLNGQKFTQKLARSLGEADYVIASGLARGIDTAAHEGSLQTGTIAVLAGGVDVVYPRENTKLYEQIQEAGGAIISECPIGTQPTARHFPKRNRIVSGLSQGVIVIEAAIRSGSLITARTALEQGREVMAVPGYPSDPRSAGPNKLIRDGATLIRNVEDVLEELQGFKPYQTPQTSASLLQVEETHEPEMETVENASSSILDKITSQPISVDELIRACHLSSSEANTALIALELSEQIQRLPGNRVARLVEVA